MGSPGKTSINLADTAPTASQSSPTESEKRSIRAAIAAQACETCRARKSKCDEQRPKCSLCRRLNVECRYREPQPTKKDKSIQFMMEQLMRMEQKLNAIGVAVDARGQLFDTGSEPGSSYSGLGVIPMSPVAQAQAREPLSPVLLWPAVSSFLQHAGVPTNDDFEAIGREGTSWFLRMESQMHPDTLPVNASLPSQLASSVDDALSGQIRIIFPDLNPELMTRYTDTFFNTYNVLYPLIDRRDFERSVLTEVVASGFGYGDYNSVLALLVFSLGRMAYDGVWAQPIQVVEGRPSGIRGGTSARPPGLDIFNEARKRMGFLSTQISLENIQALQLMSIYYEACSRHMEFWRSSVSASMALQVLLKCEPFDWSSEKGNMFKKVYWTSNLMENWYHIDLDLPRTGIGDHEDSVPLPGEGSLDATQELVQMQFLAMITLRRLITRIHVTLFEASSNHPPETRRDFTGPPANVIKELAQQLDNWRILLPQNLQWRDDDRFGLPPMFSMDPKIPEPLFTIEPSGPANNFEFKNAIAMVSAQLRSRYYYARFMIYRPFLYKALHTSQHLSDDDQQCAAECLQACLLWPISMDPPKGRKRLVPYLFAWTQNFLGILLILRITTLEGPLRSIAEKYLNPSEIEQTIYLLLDWFRDMRMVDAIADWSWKILERVYSDVLNR